MKTRPVWTEKPRVLNSFQRFRTSKSRPRAESAVLPGFFCGKAPRFHTPGPCVSSLNFVTGGGLSQIGPWLAQKEKFGCGSVVYGHFSGCGGQVLGWRQSTGIFRLCENGPRFHTKSKPPTAPRPDEFCVRVCPFPTQNPGSCVPISHKIRVAVFQSHTKSRPVSSNLTQNLLVSFQSHRKFAWVAPDSHKIQFAVFESHTISLQ